MTQLSDRCCTHLLSVLMSGHVRQALMSVLMLGDWESTELATPN
jgi:hypothetical protein